MSEQEDIDSDFMPNSQHTIESAEEMVSDDEAAYNSSHREIKVATHDTHVYDRTKDDDIDSDSESFSMSEEEYYSSSEYEEEDPPVEKDGDSDTSPTGVSDVDGGAPVKAEKTKEKKKGFLGKLRGFSFHKKNKKKELKRNSDLSDGDIERSESASYDQSGKSYPYYDDTIKSQDQEQEGMMTNKSTSQSTYYVGDVTDETTQDVPMNDSHPPLSEKPARNSIQEERRKSYERILPGVVEETSQDEVSQEPPPKDPEEHSYGSFVKREESDKDAIDIPPEKTPDPPERQVQSKGRKGKLKGSESPRTTKPKKKKDASPLQTASPNVSALAAKNHAATSRRLDYAGQITSSTKNLTNKLESEVHRLKTLVELMMTRMELYERQSECLVETSVEHNRQWKQAMLESHEARRQTKLSPTDEQLANIKNLLIERSIQDKWIRQLEGIQRGYEQRLDTTQSQLRTLRYEHIRTNKAIVDLKKNGGASSSNRTDKTPDTLTENSTNSSRERELAATPVAKNIPMQRWVSEASSPAGPPVRFESPKDALDTTAKSNRSLIGELPKAGTLLEEMIVSWHSDPAEIDATDMSPLSDRMGRKKIKPKKEKKKKKSKKSKHPRD